MASPGKASPRLAGVRYAGHGLTSAIFTFHYNGVHFQVVAASPEDRAGGEALVPPLYMFDESRLEDQLAKLTADACLPTMQQLAPTRIPDAQTLEQYLYPQTYTLQILTNFGRGGLTCRSLDGYPGIPERHPPVSEDSLRAMELDLETTDVPVVKASQVILVRRLQGLVWKVTVDGEEMICKASIDMFHHPLDDELETYLKIRSAGAKLRIPELKGIVVSYRGVIGILLGYVPHEHHNLRVLLARVDAGAISPDQATAFLRRKWATQIRETLRGLHNLGILWRDVKTDNVLINEDGDAVVLDFGGGNTMGWVDQDKYGSMEGEEQGLNKTMEALGVAGLDEE
ncbi:hypothetical protein C8A03DRAFT_44467 [Achaetomium macrosporum]|uniref:Protein kinase domain-containing protein n=1 Tax=Achaetomium macrosporum TaxID=79813 RepID=A0AAN7C963_9PEZI|nr:hypothetical protein C8A03DRAFT_44467 [Achaetomium macrosporum]